MDGFNGIRHQQRRWDGWRMYMRISVKWNWTDGGGEDEEQKNGGRLFRRPKLTLSCSAEGKEGRNEISSINSCRCNVTLEKRMLVLRFSQQWLWSVFWDIMQSTDVFSLLHASLLFGLMLDPEDGGDISLLETSCDFYWTTGHYIRGHTILQTWKQLHAFYCEWVSHAVL
jgi:hypothetical protein